jgi:hypothetical protein
MKGLWKKAALVIVAVLLLQMVVGVAAASTASAAPPAYGPIYHVVRSGESLSSIGRLYGVSPWAICQANGLYNCNYIQAGWVLLIPSGGGWPQPRPCPWWCYQSYYGGYGGSGGYGGYSGYGGYGGYGGYYGTGYYGGYGGYPGYGWDP